MILREIPGYKQIKMPKPKGSEAPENRDLGQPNICSSAQVSTPPKTAVKGNHYEGGNSHTSIDSWERLCSDNSSTPKVQKSCQQWRHVLLVLHRDW